MFKVPEKYRITSGLMGTSEKDGNNGLFRIRHADMSAYVKKRLKSTKVSQRILTIIASDGEGWEHVSVSTPDRCPTWEEMCFIKDLFWDEEDYVMQLHPPHSQYVNNHDFCLHLWRKSDLDNSIFPPASLVGITNS